VDRVADAVVGRPGQGPSVVDDALHRLREGLAARIQDGVVVETGGAGRRRAAPFALPGVEADVVVVAAGADEGGLVLPTAHDLEAENPAVEVQRPLDVGDLEVYVADPHLRLDHVSHTSLLRSLGARDRGQDYPIDVVPDGQARAVN